jgi:hypothetical protein
VWLASAVPGWAGEVKLSFSNGLVSVVATDASPREILAEWARLGQVRVTNLDRLAGVPVTLQLTDVPEGKALETILRGTAGYIAAPRGEANWTVSRYDRILLMPGLAPPMPAAAPSPQPSAAIGRGRPGQLPFGASGASGTGSPGDTPYWSEPASGANITRPGPNRPMTPQSGPQSFVVVPGPQSFVVAQPVESGDAQQAAPLPTSSQVPGMPVGRAGQWNGATRPGQATALPTSPPKPPGQPLTPAPVGPIKVPE